MSKTSKEAPTIMIGIALGPSRKIAWHRAEVMSCSGSPLGREACPFHCATPVGIAAPGTTRVPSRVSARAVPRNPSAPAVAVAHAC